MASNEAAKDDWEEVPIAHAPPAAGADDWEDAPLEPSLGQKALNGIGMLGRAIDKYGGGTASRAAIGAAQDVGSLNPLDWAKAGGKAFIENYGKDPDQVPTGEDLVKKAGVPEGLPSKAAGFAMDVASDPMNLLPLGRPILEGVEKGGKFLGDALKGSYLGQKTAEAVNAAGRGAAHLGETISGAPYQDIVTYATKTPEVNAAIEKSGRNAAQLGDDIRQGFQNTLTGKRSELNQTISAAEDAASTKKLVPIKPLLDRLDQARSRLQPELDTHEIAQIDELSQKLENLGNSRGLMSPSELVKVTQSLQNKGAASYGLSPSGAQLGSQVQQAAKRAGAEARVLRNQMIPGVKEPFEELEKINHIADEANPNLFIPGKPENALFAAASGKNPRGLKNLEEMGKAVGSDFVGPAQVGSSARTFMSPSLTPTDTTGKSLHRALISAGLFGQGLGILGAPVEFAAKVGAAAASPAALKLGIDVTKMAGKSPAKVWVQIRKLSDDDFLKLFGVVKTAETEATVARALTNPPVEKQPK